MKKISFALTIIVVITFSCNSYKGYKIIGDGKNCFSFREKKNIIDAYKDEKTKYLGIRPLITIKGNCIGLYGIIFSNLNISVSVIDKALKFENEYYLFDPNSPQKNEDNFARFEKKYSNQFSKEDFDKLKSSYFKGTEIEGRLF